MLNNFTLLIAQQHTVAWSWSSSNFRGEQKLNNKLLSNCGNVLSCWIPDKPNPGHVTVLSQHQYHSRFQIQLFSCVPTVQHVLQPGRGEGRHWQTVPRWPPWWHFLLLHPGGVLLQLHDSRQHSSCTLHRGNMYPSCMQCLCVKQTLRKQHPALLSVCLFYTHTVSKLTISQTVTVCAYVKTLVAHLLPVVATDVRWQNRGVIAASIDFTYKGERRRASGDICT